MRVHRFSWTQCSLETVSALFSRSHWNAFHKRGIRWRVSTSGLLFLHPGCLMQGLLSVTDIRCLQSQTTLPWLPGGFLVSSSSGPALAKFRMVHDTFTCSVVLQWSCIYFFYSTAHFTKYLKVTGFSLVFSLGPVYILENIMRLISAYPCMSLAVCAEA